MTACYFAPTQVSDALEFLASRSALVIAGGTDIYPALRSAMPSGDVLDITRIEGLRGVARSMDRGFRIGAATTWADIVKADLPPAFAALQAAAREVGSIQIQNTATIGGNLCNASPAADGVPPLLTLNTEVEIATISGTRRMALEDFLIGPRKTALRRGEVLTALSIPTVPETARSAFEKLGARRYLVISIVMTSVLIDLGPEGAITEARIAVGACSAVAQRLRTLEVDLIGQQPRNVKVNPAALAPLTPQSDVRGDAAYRYEAAAELIRRAIARAADE